VDRVGIDVAKAHELIDFGDHEAQRPLPSWG
jgi:hypothetical protein